jgi:hypothetical protein
VNDTTKWKERVERENLASLMSDTRWSQLVTALVDAHFLPEFRVKVIGERESSIGWESSFPHHLPSPYLCIEWLELSGRFSRHRGKLVPDAIVDRSSELEQILRQTRVPFTIDGGVFRVWGHVAPGLSPQFVSQQ